ncbi:MAG: geranylgeranyl reductase family protein [Actinomycetota bacterium]|nr:geranylgeranyl reductase family protein [Actinomycetota bacterium]
MQQTCDVLIVGAGPGGASCAYWLARLGISAVVVEKKVFPREKTCGDGLTPRSVHQLEQMGLSGFLQSKHRYHGLRAVALGRELELNWPEHPELPDYGYVVSRYDLDGAVAANAAEAGATVLQGAEAVAVERGPAGEAAVVTVKSKDGTTTEYTPKYLVVADGSNSRIGRQLGAARDRSLPMGLALRGYFNSPLTGDDLIESHLDIRTAEGEVMPGYGWIFPMGDGRVNVGVGILSTLGRWKEVNTTKVMEAFVASAPARWKLDPADPIYVGTGGKLPMGFAVGPRVGPNFLMVGDAAGAINPFNGEGIAYGYETGRLAAEVIADALALDDARVLRRYERDLEERYGDYYRIARAFVGLIGHPAVMRAAVGAGIRSKLLMDPVMRVMANLMNDGHNGPAELLYRAGRAGLVAKDRLEPLVQAGRDLLGARPGRS